MMARVLQRVAQAVRSFVRRRTVEQELDDELQFHFEQMARAEAACGGSPEQAQLQARRRFGGMNQVKEACRDMRTLRPLEHLLQDIRFGVRLLSRSPVFTLVAVLSLALGIGANSAIFSVINVVVLRSLPVEKPGELVVLQSSRGDSASQRFSYPLVQDLEDSLHGRAEVCAQSSVTGMKVSSPSAGAAADSVRVQLFSSGCFATLRQRAQIGRLLDARDNAVARPVAVISDSYWLRRFNRNPAALGSDLIVNDTALTIVGVTMPPFFGAALESRPPDLWAPVTMQPALRYSGNVSNSNGDTHKPWPAQRELSWLAVMLRVPDGQAGGLGDVVNAALQRNYSQMSGFTDDAEFRSRLMATHVTLRPGSRGFSGMRERVAAPLFILLAMVAVVLTVACGNLASLLLARATHRNREMAVRLSIGAGRGRLVRQLLTESLLLALLGGAGGLLVAIWGSDALVRYSDGGGSAMTVDVRPDWRVLLFTLGISVLTGLLFGLMPALRATRVSLAEAMKSQAKSVVGGTSSTTSRVLIAGQMALSLLLLIAAGLFGRSLQQLLATDVGFNRGQVLAVRLNPDASGYALTDRDALHQRLLERVGALPGVVSVAMSGNGPFSGSRTTSGFEVEGYTHTPDERLTTQEEVVTPRYFETVGLRIVRGRGFTDADVITGRRVSVINETVARRYFKGDPIGRRWSYDSTFGDEAFEVVGVAADARYNDLRTESLNMVYRPARQADWYLESLEVRTSGDAAAVAPSVQAAIREAEPRLTIGIVETLDSRVARTVGPERMLTVLIVVFGLVALGLACLGLYGTVSYAVTRRTSELGVRMALGADRSAVRWLIMREALTLVLSGLAAGVPLALVSARALKGVLFGVSSLDLPAYLAAIAVLLAIATLAAYLPARRASRLDPVAALRAE